MINCLSDWMVSKQFYSLFFVGEKVCRTRFKLNPDISNDIVLKTFQIFIFFSFVFRNDTMLKNFIDWRKEFMGHVMGNVRLFILFPVQTIPAVYSELWGFSIVNCLKLCDQILNKSNKYCILKKSKQLWRRFCIFSVVFMSDYMNRYFDQPFRSNIS